MKRKRLIHLSRCKGITRKVLRRMLQIDTSLEIFYQLNIQETMEIMRLNIEQATTIYRDIHDEKLKFLIHEDVRNCIVITIFDDVYPQSLRSIQDPPLVFYALGDIDLLNETPALSVIGTRKPTIEAQRKTNYIVEPLASNDWVIVSGMARGIDSFAHKATMNVQGKTIAVLGGGFSFIYPQENINLFYDISTKGLVISEYSPFMRPRSYHFPERNRIISGLSFGTLVIEAKTKSGTLITVDQALDQGREVYALPGSPLSRETEGCHEMIQDGAKLVTKAEDIMEDWLVIGTRQNDLGTK